MPSVDSQQTRDRRKLLILVLMAVGISGLHLFMSHNFERSHILARELYFLPIILSAFWFGLRGAVITALGITAFYLMYSAFYWRGFSADDLDRLLGIAMYNIVAITVGFLQERQKAGTREKLESIKALAGTVAHEMNSPLFVAIGNLELLQDDFDKNTEPYMEMKNILKNLNMLKKLIKRISQLEEVVTRDYDGTSRIVDLDKSSPPAA